MFTYCSVGEGNHDPDCMISHLSELIRLMKATNGDMSHLQQVECFALATDCVDKDVITEIIDFGTNLAATNYSPASFTANISAAILVEQLNFDYSPSDTRVAFAIRAGLIEMCLSFIDRFGGHELFGRDDEQHLFNEIQDILIIVYEASLHKKSAKAIGSKRSTIEEKLVHLEQKQSTMNNIKCKKLIDMVSSILNLNGAYCCRCNKPLGRKDIKRCNGCNRMTYCSKACQREDWLNGHNQTCNKEYTDEQSGQFQGRLFPEALPENERAAAKLEVTRNQYHDDTAEAVS